MKPSDAKARFPTEASLCDLFMRDMHAIGGWTCYPETAGFDILVAHTNGRQIGVEAKLQLNAKVADQILPSDYAAVYGQEGPDHRVVIVACITDASAGIARMLKMLGVTVWAPRAHGGEEPHFNVADELHYEASASEHGRQWREVALGHVLYDWNPTQRCALPDLVPNVPAGVPAPVRWTPWKAGALRVLALLKLHGRITAKQIATQGISPSTWTQQWLVRAPEAGFWLPTEKTPFRLIDQHPAEYAAALAEISAKEAA